MAKDPAMLWYWNDWHGGTITMSRHLKGCYMDLLYAQFNNGRLSLSEIKIVLGMDFGAHWPSLLKKFKQDEDGNYYNEKAESEKIKREQFTKKQTAVGSLGGRPKKTQTKPVGYQNHNPNKSLLENVNENRIENENGIGVQGENQKTWDMEKYSFLHSGNWTYQFCTSKGINEEYFNLVAAKFISDIELKEDFKSVKELRNHFTNWYNQKLKSDGRKPNQTNIKTATGKFQPAGTGDY